MKHVIRYILFAITVLLFFPLKQANASLPTSIGPENFPRLHEAENYGNGRVTESFAIPDSDRFVVITEDSLFVFSQDGQLIQQIDRTAERYALSADRRTLAIPTGNPDYEIAVWDLVTAKQLALFTHEAENIPDRFSNARYQEAFSSVRGMALTADGGHLVVAYGDFVHLYWDIAAGEALRLSSKGAVAAVLDQDFAIAPDESLIIGVAQSIGTFIAWSMAGDEPELILWGDASTLGTMPSQPFLPNNKEFLIITNKYLRLYRLENNTLTKISEGGHGQLTAPPILLDPTGEYVIVFHENGRTVMRIPGFTVQIEYPLELDDMGPIDPAYQDFEAFTDTGEISHVIEGPDGPVLFGSTDGGAYIWQTPSTPWMLGYSPDSNLAIYEPFFSAYLCFDGQLVLADLTRQPVETRDTETDSTDIIIDYPFSSPLMACEPGARLAYNPQYGFLAVGQNQRVTILDVQHNEVLHTTSRFARDFVSLEFSRDGTSLLITTWPPDLDLQTAQIHGQLTALHFDDSTGGFSQVDFAITGKPHSISWVTSPGLLAVADLLTFYGEPYLYSDNPSGRGENPGRVRIFDLAGEQLLELDIRGQVVALTPDGQYLVVGYRNGELEMFDLQGDALAKLTTSHLSGLKSIWFSNDGETLYVLGVDNSVSVWELPLRQASDAGD